MYAIWKIKIIFFRETVQRDVLKIPLWKGFWVHSTAICHCPNLGHGCLAPGLGQQPPSWSFNFQFPPLWSMFHMTTRMNFYSAKVIMSLLCLSSCLLLPREILNLLTGLESPSRLHSLSPISYFPISPSSSLPSNSEALDIPNFFQFLKEALFPHLWAFECAFQSAWMVLPATSPHPSVESLLTHPSDVSLNGAFSTCLCCVFRVSSI